MSRPTTFERVYAALRHRLRDGSLRPGARLEPASLSDDLNASVTPVRDALHRLTGERLVEAPRHEGFRVPMLSETMLRHLFAWHRDLIWLSLSSRQRRDHSAATVSSLSAELEGDRPNNAFLFALTQSISNPEHLFALENLAERLHPIERLEHFVLDAIEQEQSEIVDAIGQRDQRRLRSALDRYYRRRERIVPQLLELLNAHAD